RLRKPEISSCISVPADRYRGRPMIGMRRSRMIASPAYPFLCRDTDRQGRIRYRLRRPGHPTVTIKGQFGSEEFAANYRTAVEGVPIEKRGIAVQHGSMAALAQSYL